MRCLTWQCSLYNSAKKKKKNEIKILHNFKAGYHLSFWSQTRFLFSFGFWARASCLKFLTIWPWSYSMFQKIFPHPQKLTHTPSLDLKFCPHCKETMCFLLLHFSGNFKQVRDGKMLRWMQRCPLQWHRKSHEQMYNHNQAGFDLFTAVPENDTYCVQI